MRGSGIAGAFVAATGTFQAGFVGFDGTTVGVRPGAAAGATVSLDFAPLEDFAVVAAAAAAGDDDDFLPGVPLSLRLAACFLLL